MTTTPPFTFYAELALGANLTGVPSSWSWTDVTPDTGGREITITRGRPDQYSDARADTCALTFNTSGGKYVPSNPLSPFYGQLDIGTPLRVLIRPNTNSASDAFGRTVSGGWGTADVGGAWTVVGTAADYSVSTTNGGRMTQGTANVQHAAVLPTSVLRVDVKARIRVNALSTGAAQSAGLAFRYSGAGTDFVRAVVEFGTGGALTARIVHRSGGVDSPGAGVTVAGLTHSTSTWYWVRVQTGYNAVRMKVWADGTAEPATWTLDGATTALTILTAGQFGCYARREVGNTNASATTDFEDFSMVDGPRIQFTGFVDAWPLRWADSSLTAAYAPVTASGYLRRISRPQPRRSRIYRSSTINYASGSPTVVAYWPMEDGSGSKSFASAVGGRPTVFTGAISLAADSTVTGSLPLPTFGGTGSIRHQVQPYTASTTWAVRWLMRIPASSVSTGAQVMSWIMSPAAPIGRWQVTLNLGSPDNLHLSGIDASGATVFLGSNVNLVDPTSGAELTDGRQLYFEFNGTQNAGNIDTSWTVWFVPDDRSSTAIGIGQTQSTAATNGNITLIYHDAVTGFSSGGHTIGHVGLGNDVGFGAGADGATGGAGDFADGRFIDLCNELNVSHLFGDLIRGAIFSTPQRMGPQGNGEALQELQLVEATELGTMHDGKQGQLELLPRSYKLNRPVDLTLDVAQGHVGTQFDPVTDDFLLRNDIIVTNVNGSSSRVTADQATLQRQGVQAEPVSVSTYLDADLPYQAQWRFHVGQDPNVRLPAIEVNLTKAPVALADAWCNCDIGSRIQVLNVPSGELPPDNLDLIIDGYLETISSTEWRAVCNVSPAKPWLVDTLDSDNRLDCGASTTSSSLTTNATAVPVTWADSCNWTHSRGDYPIVIGGERMTVTGVADGVTDTFTRTVSNGWGTATSGQAWTVTSTASDYSTTGTLGRIATTTIANLYYSVLDTGSSDHRIQVTITCPVLPTGNPITLRVPARWTDANNYYEAQLSIATTGVATLSINERVAGVGAAVTTTPASVTVGTHAAGNAWTVVFDVLGSTLSARAWNASTGVDAGVWQLTGTDTSLTTGTNAGVGVRRETGNTNGAQNIDFDNLSVPNPQVLTVTRSVNGIVKAHVAGEAVHVANPIILGL